MDTSNPVVPSDRRSLSELIEAQKRRRRQDLGYLRDVARTAMRIELPVERSLVPLEECKEIHAEFVRTTPKVAREITSDLPVSIEEKFAEIPICGLLTSTGAAIHPPNKNNLKGVSCVRRVMGGVPGVPHGFQHIVEVVGREVLDRKHVYTCGTWQGFVKRLDKQMGRKTVSISQAYKNEMGFEADNKYLIKRLSKLLPREKTDWPSLSEDLGTHLERLKITGSSSAGAPYWRNKSDVIDVVVEEVLPLVVKTIKEDKLQDLWVKNPELFVCEVKNKLDRYEIKKLNDKVRPYCCIPAHFALLFSVLTQKFQEGLLVFDKTNKPCVNAYGFSSAGGGLERMADWMYDCGIDGQPYRYVVYGDDTCIVVREDGQLYRIDPDFSQMDGSLDQQDIKLVCEWVYRTLMDEEEDDENPFWYTVSQLWADMAADPVFLLNGPTVYKKKRPNGMMSGVPGTTLFDTVKSALMWDLFFQVCERDNLNPMEDDIAITFMARNGLEIKEGTFEPAPLPDRMVGNLLTDHKFLGVQIRIDEYDGEEVYVPTIPEEDALEMLVVQKDNPFEKEMSKLTAQRTLYDRCRGLFITFGFTIPIIRDAINNIVNNLDPAVILMATQLGTGEKPDHILLEDFAYPDSSGFPSEEFCYSLYKGKDTSGGWIQIFPELVPILAMVKDEDRVVTQIVKGVEQKRIEVVSTGTQVDFDFDKEFDLLHAPHKIKKPNLDVKPNKRSHICDKNGEVARKTTPTLAEDIRLYLERIGMAQVHEVICRYQIGYKTLEKAVLDAGLFVTGYEPEDVISYEPIVTPAATKQEEVMKTIVENDVISSKPFINKFKSVVKKMHDGAIGRGARPIKHYFDTTPEIVYFDSAFVVSTLINKVTLGPDPKDLADCIDYFIRYIKLRPEVMSAKFVNSSNYIDTSNCVEITCLVQVGNPVKSEWVPIAIVRSFNKQFAKGYIAAKFLKIKGVKIPMDKFTHVSSSGISTGVDWSEDFEEPLKPEKVSHFFNVLNKYKIKSNTAAAYLAKTSVDHEQVDKVLGALNHTLEVMEEEGHSYDATKKVLNMLEEAEIEENRKREIAEVIAPVPKPRVRVGPTLTPVEVIETALRGVPIPKPRLSLLKKERENFKSLMKSISSSVSSLCSSDSSSSIEAQVKCQPQVVPIESWPVRPVSLAFYHENEKFEKRPPLLYHKNERRYEGPPEILTNKLIERYKKSNAARNRRTQNRRKRQRLEAQALLNSQ